MDEIGARGVHLGEREALQQGELLQHHRALGPGAGLAHGVDMVAGRVVVGGRFLVVGLEAGQVVGAQQAGVPFARGVDEFVLGAEGLDGLGDEAPVPAVPRPLDLRLAAAAGALGLLQDPCVGIGEGRVAEQRPGAGRPAGTEIQCRRCRPGGLEERPALGDGVGAARRQGEAVTGVADGVLEDVAWRHGAVVAEQDHPAVEGAGHHQRQQAGAGYAVETEVAVGLGRRLGRRRALAAQANDFVGIGLAEQRRHLTGGAVHVGLHHLQGEAHGAGRVEGVAAVLQHRHAGRRGQVVGRGADAEGTADLGARCEGVHGQEYWDQ